MKNTNSIGEAQALGYTKRIVAIGGFYELELLVKPDADTSDCFWAFDVNCDELITVNGWLFECEACD